MESNAGLRIFAHLCDFRTFRSLITHSDISP